MLRVYIIDDDLEVLEGLAGALRGAGYEVAASASGQDAVRTMRARAPDALITDLVMPMVSGLSIIEACRADAALATLRILAVSSSPRLALAARMAGANDFLAKPFAWSVAVEAITYLIENAG